MKATWTVNGQRRAVDAPDDMPVLWVLRDIRELQFVEPPAGHREADQAASVRGHEVDGLERDSSKFRGET